jgi:deaminated glutathione amidase
MSGPATFRVGLVQLCSGADVSKNMNAATRLIRQAAAAGADYIQTPEVTTLMQLERAPLLEATSREEDNPSLSAFQCLARDLKVWLHIGSMAVQVADGKLANRSYVLTPDGAIAARYDKIHMFDVDLPSGESYRESANYRPGQDAVVVDTPWGGLGLTVCYDLRFPQLHRSLAQNGAMFLAAPAAFTKTTGVAHWHVLLRARAIEAQCFVFAAAQGGLHDNGRATYGHSLIVSPWGQVLAEGGENPDVVIADINVGEVAEVRQRVPSLTHDRPFALRS